MDANKTAAYAVFLLALVTRGYALWETKTFYHADEVYQFLEQAHKLAFGYGVTPWEYLMGVRSWFYPIILYAILKAAALLGYTTPSQMIFSARVFSTLCSLALIYVVYLMGRDFYGKRVGLIAALISATSVSLIMFSPSILSEIPSLLFSTAGAYLLYAGFVGGNRKKSFLAGLLIGVAFMFRFAAAILLAPMMLFLLWFRRWREIAVFASGFVLVVFAQGLLDYGTWGSFLASPINYFRFNVVEGWSTFFGVEPYYFYVVVLAVEFPALIFLGYALSRKRETLYLCLGAGFYFIALSFIPHKEYRFMLTVLPFYHVLGAKGMENALRGLSKKNESALLYGLIAVLAVLSYGALQYHDWTEFNSETLALEFVGLQNDSTGLAYSTYWGAYSTVHKNIPLQYLPTPVDCHGGAKPSYNGSEIPNVAGITFEYSEEESVLINPGVNYVVVCDPHAKLFSSKLDAEGFKKIKDFGSGIYVYHRKQL